jgi:hypothetical protein
MAKKTGFASAERKDGKWHMNMAPWQRDAVDAIRAKAMSLGWTMAELYGQTSTLPFPYGSEWGLALHLNLHEEELTDGRFKIIDVIHAVTANRIEIKTIKTLNGRPFVDDKGDEIPPTITGVYKH